ncbi:aminoglycoside phosphotransferase (APT) family kinase protein [Alkalihalobacillus xiaoxiensis]|uniref:Aminoglycoside phosphotransferase (APT) family kinase protein n=1 Tax=Shouchella xiaoxiensis TaxID=766895 RepID=A0ABS2SUZ1_9BACI|nr:aminoglycoside phosphotransferase family protein [Shouchella xiaoxiensis]MBM7838841.1 aminoglycoside phosphotransferase (APT) family kinase protein [Shouchella xiaoxiensis]
MDELQQIAFVEEGDQITKLDGGHSADQKYKLTKQDQQSYLVRIFQLKDLDKKQAEFALLTQLQNLQVKAPLPIDIGSIPTLQLGYSIVSFIEGESGEKAVKKLSPTEQLQLGREAGHELLQMHELRPPTTMPSWYEQKYAKHQRYLDEYGNGSTHIDDADLISQYIESQAHLMIGRPTMFQHDDYHLNNIIVKNGHVAGVIDFERFDWGDPVHEFLKIGLFTRHLSTSFSTGLIQGYHLNQDPDEQFWKLYGLYTAMAIFSSIVWTAKVMPAEMDSMLKRISTVLQDHHRFERLVPIWYKGNSPD